MKRFFVALTAMLAFCIANADEANDKLLQVSGEWIVSLDAQGHVLALDQTTQLKPVLGEPLERAIRTWVFEPGKINGQPQPTETTLSVSVSLLPIDGDHYSVRVDSVSTGGRFKKLRPPRMDRSLLRGTSTTYLFVLKIAYDETGKIVSVLPEESAPKIPPRAWKDIEEAAKQWSFEPERVNGRGIASVVIFPLCVSISGLSASKSMPKNAPCDWREWKGLSTPREGQVVAVSPSAKLLTDVIGHTL